nr:hypothetical protein GCM10020093_057580 [Planobispora longispora]
MLETVATRSPAITTGTAIGSSTASSLRAGVKPMATADWRTCSGTESSPSTTAGSSTAIA